MTNSFARAKFLPKLGRWGEGSYNLVFRIGQGFYNTILKNIKKIRKEANHNIITLKLSAPRI